MASKIYFSNLTKEGIKSLATNILSESSFDNKRTAVKLHFGEKGNTRYVNPNHVKILMDVLREKTGDYFLTDTNTLYRGMRTNATDHKKIAYEHGFANLGAPIIIADGEYGDDEKNVKINKKHFQKAKLGREIYEAETMMVISHFKGHVLYGFGGALKNLAMGCASRAGKLAMHSKISPVVGEGCVKCGICAENCDVNAIEIGPNGAQITDDCIGCAQCIAVCPEGVIKVPWHGATPYEAIERGAEYAYATTLNKPCVYFTFVNNVTRECDCLSDSELISEDVGVLAGFDPVAIDKAAYDLLKEKNQDKDVFKESGNPDGLRIIDYAQELGVGTKDYTLERI
ncbi:MAG: DUF362 domain-containing protein [Nanobdellota archaeon]